MRSWLEFARLLPVLMVGPSAGCGQPASPPITGTLEVTTRTSGAPTVAIYSLQVDDSIRTMVAADGRATVAGLAAGTHAVSLMDVPAQCTSTSGSVRSVEIPPGATVHLTFEITCSPPGSLRVITSMSGDSLDPDGYTVVVNGIAKSSIGTADTLIFDNLNPGNVQLSLTGVAANCAPDTPLPTSVRVGSGGQTTVTIGIHCHAPTVGGPAGVIQVTVTSSLINAGPIRSFSAVLDRAHSMSVPVNGAASFTEVAPGTHSVRLVVPSYCAVGAFTHEPNPVGIVLRAAEIVTVRFSVLCIG